jgi:tetratricopeptide (TPR) repeat protein
MIICTRQQVHYWRDSFTLYKHALNVTEDNHRIHDNFGTVLSAQGKLDEAIRHYLEALRIKPNSAKFCFNLAVALTSQGKLDEAIRYYRQALRIKPDYVEAHNNLGSVLSAQGKLDEAIRHYRRALENQPDSFEAHNNLALALLMTNLSSEALEFSERAAKLSKYQNPIVLDLLATAYSAVGQFDRAVTTARKAVALASAVQNHELANAIRQRLKLYKQGKPYRHPVPKQVEVPPL